MQFLNGEWPETCERCRVAEEFGGNSRRLSELAKFKDSFTEALNQTKPDGTVESPKILSVDLRPGNLCNLSCRMCSPVASSKWVNEWSRLNYQWFEPSKEQLKVYDWFKDNDNLKSMSDRLLKTEHLHFGGGEPLFIQETFDLLNYCIDQGISKNIKLSYNTNLTKLPDKVFEIWPQFKSIDLLVSLDGVGKVNDYIRSGSNFSEIDKNLNFVDQNFTNLNLSEASIMCTVQIFNVFDLENLFNYTKSFSNISPFPELTPLYMPDEFSIQQLSQDLKSQAIKSIDILSDKCHGLLTKDKFSSHRKRLSDLIEIKEFLMQEAPSDMSHELKEMTLDLDDVKKMSLEDVNTTLYNWIMGI